MVIWWWSSTRPLAKPSLLALSHRFVLFRVMMVLWWCCDGVMMVLWWCCDGVMMLLWWCYDALMMVLWCCYDGVMMLLWCCYKGSMVVIVHAATRQALYSSPQRSMSVLFPFSRVYFFNPTVPLVNFNNPSHPSNPSYPTNLSWPTNPTNPTNPTYLSNPSNSCNPTNPTTPYRSMISARSSKCAARPLCPPARTHHCTMRPTVCSHVRSKDTRTPGQHLAIVSFLQASCSIPLQCRIVQRLRQHLTASLFRYHHLGHHAEGRADEKPLGLPHCSGHVIVVCVRLDVCFHFFDRVCQCVWN
jgi:hypothetical protein